ncbi:MAG: N-6 DNA methylase [Pyrinomonadaceae bacterium]
MNPDFDQFLDSLFSKLAADNFYQSESLTHYLNLPSVDRSGDEANIVDAKITSILIEALGYSSGEVQYNLASANRKRTDFTVRIADYPRPCFVAESKNTVTTKLSENLPQLADYMRSQGATRGLLIDGKTILSYELNGGQIVLTGDIELRRLVETWRGENLFSGENRGVNAIDKHDIVLLKAFWQRFNKSSFEGLPNLINDLTLTVNGDLHSSDGETWPGQSRIKIFRQSEAEFNDALTKESASVIAMIALDVEAQLSLRLSEYKQFEIEENVYTNESDTFEMRFESLWASIFSMTQAWQIPESRRNSYSSRLRYSFKFGHSGEVLVEVKNEIALDIAAQNSILPEFQKKSDKDLKAAVKEVSNVVDEIERLRRIFHRKRERLSAQYRQSIDTYQAYKKWKDKVATILLKTSDERRLQREFATQTAYVLFVRLLLVRVLEDKKLISRIFTNGGIVLWFEKIEEQYLKHAEGRSTDFLLGMAYESAQHIYAHYYSDAFVFDWYRADRNLIVQLLHRLAGFDFTDIDRDIIGHIYSGYIRSEHKHESGMYYTPIQVVEYILNQVGYQGDQILGKNLLDPSCGSGAFLVSACRRQIETFLAYYKAQGKSKNDLSIEEIRQILNAVKNNLFGLELNPFACYLAETNLLIQMLDLIKLAREKGGDISLDRFNIFNTDTLRYEPETRDLLRGIPFPAEELEPAEQLKSGLATFREGFDFVVGNPPYVKADEGSEGLLEYRSEIKNDHPIESVRRLLVLKWDLFIPFIGLGVFLLRNETGRLGMITSSAIEQVTYAANLRQHLVHNYRVDEVSFFPQMRLFDDAAVENTVLIITNTNAVYENQTLRKWHGQLVDSILNAESVSQLAYGENVFRQTVSSQSYSDTTPMREICYISKGMVLHSHEVNYPGAFRKEILITFDKDQNHTTSYVEGENLTPYEVDDMRFLEYGESARAPSQVSRPTFPQLYDRRKIMRGETSSAWLDNGTIIQNGWMFCNHSVHLFVRWCELKDVKNRSVTGELANQDFDREELENISGTFSLEFLLAIINSPKGRAILEATTSSSRRSRFQPDDFRKLPIPNATYVEQAVITEKCQRF